MILPDANVIAELMRYVPDQRGCHRVSVFSWPKMDDQGCASKGCK